MKLFKPIIVLCVVALAVFLVVLLRRDEAPQTQEEIAASAPAPLLQRRMTSQT